MSDLRTLKAGLLIIVSISISLLFTPYGFTVLSSPLPSMSVSSLPLSANPSFNDNYQSLQRPPIANAGPNQVVTTGSTVILNGSNSRASNGIILAYSWKQIPTDAQITLSGVNTPVWEFKAPNVSADTLLRFQLNVTDNLGQVGTAFVNVLDRPVSESIALPSNQIVKSPFTAVHLLPKLKTENVTNRIVSSSLPSAKTTVHIVKITSPTKGQLIPAHGNLTVSGTSVANSTSGNCDVSVIVNGIKPYQKTVATGKEGINDYSTWNYRLTSANAVIKQGQNKITAKFSCANNPSLTSYNSANVIGVASNNQVIAPSPQPVSIPNTNSKLLFISLGLAKNSISPGDEETIKIRVLNPSNPNMTIVGASVIGIVTDSANTTTTNFNGITDSSGIFTYTWNISKNSKPGIFTVSVLASVIKNTSQGIDLDSTSNKSENTFYNNQLERQELAPPADSTHILTSMN